MLNFRLLASVLLIAGSAGAAVSQNSTPTEKTLTPQQVEQLNERAKLLKAAGEVELAGRLKEAVGLLEKSLAITRDVHGPKHDDGANLLRKIASVQMELENWAAARAAWNGAIEILTVLHGREDWRVTDTKLDLADVDIYERLTPNDRKLVSRALELLSEGGQLQNQGKFVEARGPLAQGLAITKKLFGDQHRKYANALSWMGRYHEAIGDLATTETLQRQTVLIWRNVFGRSHPAYAFGLNNLGMLFLRLGHYEKAEPLLRQSLAIRQKTLGIQHPDYATAVTNLAALYVATGDLVRAESLSREASDILLKGLGPQHPRYIASLGNLASILDQADQPAKALPLLTDVVEYERKHLGEKSPTFALSLNNLGLAYSNLGNIAKAESLLSQSLVIIENTQGSEHATYIKVLNNLGMLYRNSSDSGKGEPFLKRSLQLSEKTFSRRHPFYATSLGNLGLYYLDARDLKKASPLLREAATVQLDILARTADVQSEGAQLTFSQTIQGVLSSYLQSMIGGSPVESYAMALRCKGRVFVHQRRQRELARAAMDPNTEKLAAELVIITSRLAAIAGQTPTPDKAAAWKELLVKLEGEREQSERELTRASTAFGQQRERETLTPEKLRKLLPARTALVDFVFYTRLTADPKIVGGSRREDHLTAFVVTPDREIVRVELGPYELIREAIDNWRKDTKRKKPIRDDDDPAAVLRNELWRPIAKHLDGIETVLISPDRDLAKLPFAALPGSKEGTYLIEELAIAILPVPQFLPDLLAPLPAANPSLLVVGDVDYGAGVGNPTANADPQVAVRGNRGGVGWKSLPATREEIAAIKSSFELSFPGRNAKTLRLGEPTEDALRTAIGQYRWVHLATHGFFAPPEVRTAGASTSRAMAGHLPGLLSGVVLAGANQPFDAVAGGDDGILTAAEVVTLDMNGVEIVVLSACETGLGQTAGGEGVLGLQRAFQVAGARTVVASLWEVPDDATRALMNRTYANWWSGKKTKLDGLIEAQRRMLREGVPGSDEKPGRGRTPPFYWAAFVLSGDWR